MVSRFMFDHIGLNFYWEKVNSQVCAHCNITENAQQGITNCVKYNEERVAQGWDSGGTPGTHGDKVWEAQRGVIHLFISTYIRL